MERSGGTERSPQGMTLAYSVQLFFVFQDSQQWQKYIVTFFENIAIHIQWTARIMSRLPMKAGSLAFPEFKIIFQTNLFCFGVWNFNFDFLRMSIWTLCDCYQKTFIRKRISLARYFITFFNNPPVNGSGFGLVIGRKIKKVKKIVNGNIRMLSRRLKFNV